MASFALPSSLPCTLQRGSDHALCNLASRPAGRQAGAVTRRRALLSRRSQAPRRVQPCQATAQATEPAGPVTEADFQEQVLNSPVPVIVDFWAPWCGPCRMIAPMVDEIAVEYGDKLRAFKLNTDESPSIATEYGIRSIPTVIIYKGGQRVDAVIGAVPKQTLMKAIDKYIN